MVESTVQFILRQIIVWTVSTIISLFIGVRLAFAWIKNPKLFDEKKYPRPQVLDTWRQGSIHLKKVTISYIEAGSPQDPLMLMIHGFPEFSYSWRHQLEHFRQDYHVVAIDMPGYGQSSSPPGYDNYKAGEIAKNVKNVIEELGSKKAIVLAHDWGAAIAWRLAAYFPEVVSKLIVMNGPNPLAFRRILSSDYAQLMKSWYMFFFQMPLLPELMYSADHYDSFKKIFRGPSGLHNKNNFTDEDELAWLYTFSPRNRLTHPINYYRALHQYTIDLDMFEKPIVPKTLIIWGKNDAFIENKVADLSAQFCESAEIFYINNGSHWIQQDFPEEVNRRIEEFLK